MDRFLTRAIIALVFLIAGMVVGFTLAGRFPTEKVVDAAPPTPTKESETPPVVATKEEPKTPPVPAAKEEPVPEPEPEPQLEPEPQPEPEPAIEPVPLTGKFVIEIRDLAGTARTKAAVRDVAQLRLHEVEACIVSHGAGVPVVRLHYQQAVSPSGEVSASLLLQGVNPELDACVGQAIGRWNYGAADESSFFKLKLIWTP